MAFRPLPAREFRGAVLVASLLAVLSLLLLLLLARNPVGPGGVRTAVAFVVVAGALAVLLYRLWALRGLDYWIERDAVCIVWSGQKIILPITDVNLRPLSPADRPPARSWWRWPAWWMHPWRPSSSLAAYATRSAADCRVLEIADTGILISPAEPEAFARALREHQALGPARDLEPGVEVTGWRSHWLFADRTPLLVLGAGLFLGLLALAYLAWHYPALPPDIPIHFDARGLPDRISPRRALFFLPSITLLIGFFNTLVGYAFYERWRPAAYMLWGGALVLQGVGLLVLRSLLHLILG